MGWSIPRPKRPFSKKQRELEPWEEELIKEVESQMAAIHQLTYRALQQRLQATPNEPYTPKEQ